MKFYFRNANPLQELNAYKKGTKMSLTQYQKALSFINEGYSFQLVVDSRKEPIKVVKVLKGKHKNKPCKKNLNVAYVAKKPKDLETTHTH